MAYTMGSMFSCMHSFNIGIDDVEMVEGVEMAEEACAPLPSALPQPCAPQVASAQVAPHAVKKRKRASKSDWEAPHCNTGQLTAGSHCCPMWHPSRDVVAAMVINVAMLLSPRICLQACTLSIRWAFAGWYKQYQN